MPLVRLLQRPRGGGSLRGLSRGSRDLARLVLFFSPKIQVVTAAITIALDAMGGDHAPGSVVGGAAIAYRRLPAIGFLLFGDEAKLAPLLEQQPKLREAVEIRHTPDAIGNGDRPSQALRRGTRSSMRLAIDAVQTGEAAGVVSAGNTGALMAMSKVVLKTQPGIDRPAMISYFPTVRGESAMVDLGASLKCDARNLVEFAIMGAGFARSVLGLERPTVGLLNVGIEEAKGNETVRAAGQTLRESEFGFEFHGFVEGNDVGAGTVDVFVTDGFTGNAVIKTTEGTALLISTYLTAAFRRSWVSRLGYLLAKPALDALRDKLDARQYNGALFLGLNGVVVKSHGGTDDEGFASAISVAADMVRGDFNERIHADLEHVHPPAAAEAENGRKAAAVS